MPSVRNVVKKTDYNTKIYEIEKKITTADLIRLQQKFLI